MFQNAFAPVNALVYRPRQQQHARNLAQRLFHNPSDWEAKVIRYVSFHVCSDRQLWLIGICRFATSITLSIAYGLTDLGDDSTYVKLAGKVAWIFGNGGPPGQTMVDILPIIRRLPQWVTIFPSLKFARQTSYPTIRDFIELPFAFVKKTMVCCACAERQESAITLYRQREALTRRSLGKCSKRFATPNLAVTSCQLMLQKMPSKERRQPCMLRVPIL